MKKLLLAGIAALGMLGLSSQAQACGVAIFPGTATHAIGCVDMPGQPFGNVVAVYKEGKCWGHGERMRCRWGRETHFSEATSPINQIGNLFFGVGNLLGGIGVLNAGFHGPATTNISNVANSASFSRSRSSAFSNASSFSNVNVRIHHH